MKGKKDLLRTCRGVTSGAHSRRALLPASDALKSAVAADRLSTTGRASTSSVAVAVEGFSDVEAGRLVVAAKERGETKAAVPSSRRAHWLSFT